MALWVRLQTRRDPVPRSIPTEPPLFERLLTAKEASAFLRVSLSWLAKARMRGDGPPFVKVGRSIRYTPTGILQWVRSCQHFSTSERESQPDRRQFK
jgi:hypothetical protein